MNDLITSYESQDVYNPIYTTSTQELNRVLSAAIVSPTFCKLLLKDPQVAISKGYQGETFHLNADERNCILSIKAPDLASFANQVLVQCDRLHRYEKIQITQDVMV
jgi:hypothetical protein